MISLLTGKTDDSEATPRHESLSISEAMPLEPQQRAPLTRHMNNTSFWARALHTSFAQELCTLVFAQGLCTRAFAHELMHTNFCSRALYTGIAHEFCTRTSAQEFCTRAFAHELLHTNLCTRTSFCTHELCLCGGLAALAAGVRGAWLR